MQVDWSKAPEWANWHAFDENGCGYWYESEPYPSDELNHFISSNRFKRSGHHDPDARSSWKQSKAKRPDQHTNTSQAAAAKTKHIHYHKSTNGAETVDVYWVLNAWQVDCHATGHAIKKLLNAGERGAKSKRQDLEEAIDSIKRAIELLE